MGLLVDPLVIVAKLQKVLQQNLQRIGDTMITGGVDNMEKYQYMLGQARAYQYALQEISNLLKQKEQENDRGGQEAEPLNPENIQKQKEQLPEPSGWRLLVLPFTPKEKTKGGILIAQESLEKLRIATNCGYVLKVGPLAYYDKEKFPTGPWCKKGDWVIFARYAGSRLPIEGGEVRLLKNPYFIIYNHRRKLCQTKKKKQLI